MKKTVFAFYNSFLKIELNCDKENLITFNKCSFQKKMLSNLTWVLMIYSLTKCVLKDSFKDSSLLKNISMMEVIVKEVTVCRITTFFHVSVECSSCTTCHKYLRESIMAVTHFKKTLPLLHLSLFFFKLTF